MQRVIALEVPQAKTVATSHYWHLVNAIAMERSHMMSCPLFPCAPPTAPPTQPPYSLAAMSRVHHSLPHCSHPALAPHILKPLPTTTLPHAASSLCSTAAIPNDARSTLSPLVSMRCAPLPPTPYSQSAMWWRVRPPAAHHHSRHHRNVRPRRPKCRPHRASSASRMMMPHSSATQPQPQSSADRTSARKPQRLPPRKPPSHTHPHACTHTHDMRHET